MYLKLICTFIFLENIKIKHIVTEYFRYNAKNVNKNHHLKNLKETKISLN